MKIDHIAIYVENLEATKEFFIKYFNATANNLYHNPKTELSTYFLSFEDNTRLEIMTRPNMIKTEFNLYQQGFIHLSFSLGNKEKVNELTARLKNDGYKILSGPRTTGDGYYESCVLGPENNILELVA
ncbi:VOC family protein [Megamonas funiformis]|uniref:VOC family protein n=1 Tax=Megamonas funiformis TaxID=437897 RepID=UPI00241F01C1|nr:VOC family protein [Megamonas funiformis]